MNTIAPALIFLATNYVSGSSLAGTSTYAGQTLALLGLLAGRYVFHSAADTVTVNIGNIAGAVPEPATWAMMLIGFGMRYSVRRSNVKFDAKIKRMLLPPN